MSGSVRWRNVIFLFGFPFGRGAVVFQDPLYRINVPRFRSLAVSVMLSACVPQLPEKATGATPFTPLAFCLSLIYGMFIYGVG